MRTCALQRLDVRRRRALLALRHVEGDLLAVLQRLEAGALDRGVMGKKILAAVIRRDESEALRIVEPLHGTCSHVISILNLLRARLSEPRSGHDGQAGIDCHWMPLLATVGGRAFANLYPAARTVPQP